MLFATLAIGMLASCSKDSGSGIDGTDPVEDTPMEINLGVKQAVLKTENTKTRGIGGIGDLDGAQNVWNGETLYIYAISSEPLDVVPTNEKATAPTGSASAAIAWADNATHFYYGGTSIYTFYGYHIDNATTDGTDPLPTGDATTGYSIPFKIDGTQDLMVAATDRTKDIEASSKKDDLTGREANLYSAWSARRDVTPNLVFKHLLSRLKFTVKAGNDGETVVAGVSVKEIAVYSRSEGTLVVVPSADGTTTTQGLKDVADLPADLKDATPFNLMEAPAPDAVTKDLVPLQPVTANSVTDAAPIGESMLVIPADTYRMVVTTSQEVNGNPQTSTNVAILKEPDGVKGATFEAGNIYTINIIVYGLKEIEVNATLTAWKDGGSITIDPDDEPAPSPAPQP